MKHKKPKLTILIPVLNEGINLKIMLKILKATIEVPHEVLIVHDIPHDDSIPVVKSIQTDYPGLRLVHNTLGRGVIHAIRAGAQAATGEYIFIIAADDVGPVLAVEDMIALMDKGCDLVNATRYRGDGRNIGGSFMSRFLSYLANKLFYLVSASPLSDLTLGVKMLRRSRFNELHLVSRPVGWAVAFEIAIKAQIAGWKLGEVPIISINRFYGGKSSFKLGPWVAEYSRWFAWGLRHIPRTSIRKKVATRVPPHLRSNRNK